MKGVRKRKKLPKKRQSMTNFITNDVDLITLLSADNGSIANGSCNDVQLYAKQKDPLRGVNKKKKQKQKEDAIKPAPDLLPSMSVRLTMGRHCEPHVYPPLKYKMPPLKGSLEGKKERRRLAEEGRKHFCKFEVVKVPSPTGALNLKETVVIKSPRISHARVMPTKTSTTKGAVYPTPQTRSLLELHKPKSGVFVNVTEDKTVPPTKKSLPIIVRRPPKRISILRERTLSALLDGEEEDYYEEARYLSVEEDMGEEEEEIDIAAEEYLRALRRKVSQTSAATSFNSRDVRLEEELSWEKIDVVSRLVQTFREENERDSKTKAKKRYKRGTLQSHSFTKLKQKTLPEICFDLVAGTIHQGDTNYAEISRDNQGICMPIAAYCYAQIQSSKYWSDLTIDEILDVGNRLYLDSIGSLHVHDGQYRELTPTDLHKYVYIRDKKVSFVVNQADVVGYVRSTDKRVYNLTKGLRLFLNRHVAGVLQANKLNVAVWKSGKKHIYFFDATARASDLCQEHTGTAVLAKFCKLQSLITVLLDRTDLDNSPFVISPIVVKKILGRHEKDEDILVDDRSNYNVLSENKAVVQASFDLGDKCFEFTRNKQAVTMAIIALIYSRITPACNWRKRTLDKIMMIGNQLYVECSESLNGAEVNLEEVPSAFSIGPYAVEIFIYCNIYTDLMYKKGACEFGRSLTEFFDKNSNAIVQMGKHTLAIWQQRNAYFAFDPYARNREALRCRSGVACVSMYATVESLIETVTTNFDDKDLIFHVHALKVLKIRRDDELSRRFPKGSTMSNIPIEAIKRTKIRRRCKRRAIERPVRVQPSEHALRKVSAGDSPGPSIYEIDSNVRSIAGDILPRLPLKNLPPKCATVKEAAEKELVCVLDSASLSDTQIEPDRRKQCPFEEEIMMVDLDSFDATMDELEMQGEGEEEGAGDTVGNRKITYTMRSIYSQVKSISLDSYHKTRSANINTDVTYNYKILPVIELPIKRKESELAVNRYYASPDDEWQAKSDYAHCEDGCNQVLCGTENIANHTPEYDRVAPFVCLFGIALNEDVPISDWHARTVDYVLKCGKELYEQHNETYDKIEDFVLSFPQNEYNIRLERLMDAYVGNVLFANSAGVPVIRAALETSIFKKYNSAIVVTPHYTCALLLYNGLYYLIDCFGGPECHVADCEDDYSGYAFVCRSKTIDDVVIKFMQIKNRWDSNASLEHVRFVVCVPIIKLVSEESAVAGRPSGVRPPDGTVADSISTTQSEELAKPNNFLQLPDGTQIVRGTTNVANYGELNIEFVAPFVGIMAACVAEKYSVVTWTREIVDYVLECGTELFRQSSMRFDQVSKIAIPKVSLGSTDYSVAVNYLCDSVMRQANLERHLSRSLTEDREWYLIVTRYYACVVSKKNYLYYLYDPFGCNEIGFGIGQNNEGVASLQRFKDLRSMVMRIMYNKNKREFDEVVEHTKFVLSSCRVIFLPPEQEMKTKKDMDVATLDESEGDEIEGEIEKSHVEANKTSTKKTNKIGYQRKGKYHVIEGSDCLMDRDTSVGELKEDHFVCLVALLNVITTSMDRWDTKRVDAVVEQGTQIHMLADNLNETDKRTIKNLLIGSHLFDVIVKRLKINDWKANRTLDIGLNVVLRKRRFCMMQFPNCAYAIYRDDDDTYHLFEPYGLKVEANDEEGDDDNEDNPEEGDKDSKSCWIRFDDLRDLKCYISDNMVDGMEGYAFYTFAVMSVRSAPRHVTLDHQLNTFTVGKRPKGDVIGKPFYEQETWLKTYRLPWSFANRVTACGKPRDRISSRWHNWYIEYPRYLFSLAGTVHQADSRFDVAHRGKQTLCNIVVALAVTNIYGLAEWNASLIDAILNAGEDYFADCVRDITEPDYEVQVSDLKYSAKVAPFAFRVEIRPLVEGTMFVVNDKKFNLYKALRYFFDHYENRCGIVCAMKGETKKFLGFGKLQENEYFIFDCQSYGVPMFEERRGVAYALRCRKLNRLLYCLVATLRGGDFFIFEVDTYNFRTEESENK